MTSVYDLSAVGLAPSIQYAPRLGNPMPTPALQSPGHQAQEMNIPNELIGCIIGRGGQKINEIRSVSYFASDHSK